MSQTKQQKWRNSASVKGLMKALAIMIQLSLLAGSSDGFTATAPLSQLLGGSSRILQRREGPSIDTSTSTQLNGIPKMFRWLTDQYPDILSRQLESDCLIDLSVDNFYLDMNGIIHPCTHGNANDKIVVLDELAMFKKIFLYVDRYVRTTVLHL